MRSLLQRRAPTLALVAPNAPAPRGHLAALQRRAPTLALGLALAALGTVFGCEDISGLNGQPNMYPGQDCMLCHVATGIAPGRQWSVAGTVFASPTAEVDAGLQDAEILVSDSATPPKTLTLRSNSVGNFYTAESLLQPIHVAIQYGGQRYQMQESPPTGACNLCHAITTTATGKTVPIASPPPYQGFDYGGRAPGRLFVPMSDGGQP